MYMAYNNNNNNNLFKPPKRRKFLTDCTHTNLYIKSFLYKYVS